MTDDSLQRSSFGIGLDPEFDSSGVWTGSVSASIEEYIADDLNAEDQDRIRSVCEMLVACLHLLEHDEDFANHVAEYFDTCVAKNLEKAIAEDGDPAFTWSEKGNVITLDFNTKTHGSA
jgi:hypothetical protein